MNRLGPLRLVPIALLLVSIAHGQSVDEIIASHIAARGGLSRLRAIQTKRVEGHLQLPGGREATLVSEFKRPNRMRMDFTTGGITATRAFDGSTGWHLLPFAGEKSPQPITGQELKDLSEDSDIDGPLVDYRQKGHSVDLVPGNCIFDNRPCFHLKIRLKDGNVQHQYLDRDSFLAIGVIKNGPDGSEVEGHLSDYRRVNGVMFSFHSEIRVAGQPEVQKYSVDKVEINVPIEDSRFRMPAAAGG